MIFAENISMIPDSPACEFRLADQLRDGPTEGRIYRLCSTEGLKKSRVRDLRAKGEKGGLHLFCSIMPISIMTSTFVIRRKFVFTGVFYSSEWKTKHKS